MHHSIQRRLVCLSIAATMAISSMPPVFAADDASTLSNQITQIQKQVDAQAEKLSKINHELANNSKELAIAQSSMSNRVRSMYMYGMDGYLQYLFSSKNVSDFLPMPIKSPMWFAPIGRRSERLKPWKLHLKQSEEKPRRLKMISTKSLRKFRRNFSNTRQREIKQKLPIRWILSVPLLHQNAMSTMKVH